MFTIRNTACVLVATIAFAASAIFAETTEGAGPKKSVAAGKSAKGSPGISKNRPKGAKYDGIDGEFDDNFKSASSPKAAAAKVVAPKATAPTTMMPKQFNAGANSGSKSSQMAPQNPKRFQTGGHEGGSKSSQMAPQNPKGFQTGAHEGGGLPIEQDSIIKR